MSIFAVEPVAGFLFLPKGSQRTVAAAASNAVPHHRNFFREVGFGDDCILSFEEVSILHLVCRDAESCVSAEFNYFFRVLIK